jgi:sensor histidine kinase YesM
MDKSLSCFNLSVTNALTGLAPGPIAVFTLHTLSSGQFLNISSDLPLVRTIVFYGCYGMITGLLGFVTYSIPAWYLKPSLRHYPASIYLPLEALTLLTSRLLAPAIFLELLFFAFDAQFFDGKETRLLFYLCAVLSFVLAFIIRMLTKMNVEVRRIARLLLESEVKEQTLVERMAVEQLILLQSQINLHFFYNALNSIAGLSSVDAETARRLIVSLAEMHRYTLKCTKTRLVPFQEEVEFIKSYLSIEAVRFRSHLYIDFQSPENCEGLRLPGLVLQPIVENAIKYGAARSVENSYVRIEIKRGEKDFNIAIYNNNDDCRSLYPENVFLDGHALKNVNDRLTAIYGAEYEFKIASHNNEVCVKLRIPIREGDYHANASG